MIGYTVKHLFQEKGCKHKCNSLPTNLSVHSTLLLYTHDTESMYISLLLEIYSHVSVIFTLMTIVTRIRSYQW